MAKTPDVSSETRHRGWLIGVMVLGLVIVLALVGAVGWWFGKGQDSGAEPPAPPASASPTAAEPSITTTPSSMRTAVAPVARVQLPDLKRVDRKSAEGVARTAVRSLVTWDAAADDSEADAVERTAVLFDPWLEAGHSTAASDGAENGWPAEARERMAFTQAEVSDYGIQSKYKNPQVQGEASTDRKGRVVRSYQLHATWAWRAGDDGSPLDAREQGRVYRVDVVQDPKTKTWAVLDYSSRSDGVQS